MVSMLEEPVRPSILLVDGSHYEILLFPCFHAKRTPTIRVKMFITIGRPYNVGKSNTVLKKCSTTLEAVPRVPRP